MWILENESDAFDGKRLWLRPGKRYLFGRTAEQPGGCLAIKGEKAQSVSRKHVTIAVDSVIEGHGQRPNSRSKVTVEDLGSKIGTTVNGEKLKGEKYVIEQDENTLQMGLMPAKFKITWFPVVLSYSFTGKEVRQLDPLSKLQNDLEQLDIKFLSEYDIRATTHVVQRKRNTSKGLQALINGRYIVNNEFVEAIVAAATPTQQLEDGANAASLLEGDFDGLWPDPSQYLPPPGNEPVPRNPADFTPNPERIHLFEGYTFIFYEQGQYDSLMGPITNGGGKALVKEAVPHGTQVDAFVRYVKEMAGERGLGAFEDGSEGKGVVVVKFLPANSEASDWFSEFYTAVSLRLDHRLIDQKDFIGAILGNDASVLRRPLQVATEHSSPTPGEPTTNGQQTVEVEENQDAPTSRQPSVPPRRRARGPARSRFKGFDVNDSDEEMADSVPVEEYVPATAESPQEGGLFVSQDPASQEPDEPVRTGRRSQRKRPASLEPEPQDIMQDFAPNAAQAKRRRIERGEIPVRHVPTPAAEGEDEEEAEAEPSTSKAKATSKSKVDTSGFTIKKEVDILDAARVYRDEAEARARAEREELAIVPEGLDLAEIRRLQIEESMELRQAPPARSREKDIQEGRWDPAWNGRQNFKKFRPRGAVAPARQPMRIIVPLEQVKTKGFGIDDDYWLEDESCKKKSQRKSQSQSQTQSQGLGSDARNGGLRVGTSQKLQTVLNKKKLNDESEMESSGDDDKDSDGERSLPPVNRLQTPRTAQNSSRQSQRTQDTVTTQSSRTTGKRNAAAPAAKEQPPKRTKIVIAPSDDDDSEDELRFRFKKRR